MCYIESLLPRFRAAAVFLAVGLSIIFGGMVCSAAADTPALRQSRGYMTTPAELRLIKEKADSGLEPYRTAVQRLIVIEATQPWTYGEIGGLQACRSTHEPPYIGLGSPLVYAKALAYHLTGDESYARTVRELLLDLTDTYGFGEQFSGANQCILNLSWYIPGWIWAADLLEEYEGWTREDKATFQRWLAAVVYVKTSWASDARDNNWGAAGSYTSALIADYLHDSGLVLVDWNNIARTPAEAYQHHNQKQFRRINGIAAEMDSRCPESGIRPYGGIPDELRRGSSGCEARWIEANDASWTYTQVHLQALVAHAELLYRRGDAGLYTNVHSDGSGSILKAINFVIDNPTNPAKSTYFKENHMPVLEPAYRFYRTEAMCRQLHCQNEPPLRFIGGASGQLLHFGTITHGFHPDEDPGPPPTVPPPTMSPPTVQTSTGSPSAGLVPAEMQQEALLQIKAPLLADTLVEMGERADVNFGTNRVLRAKSNSSKNRISYLRFDLSGIPTDFGAAILRLYGATDNAGEIGVHAVREDAWRESEVTWNNKPGFDEQLALVLVDTAARWWEFDVSAFVMERRAAGATKVSFAVVSAASGVTLAEFHSSNNPSGFKPELLIIR